MFLAPILIRWRFLPAGRHPAESPPCAGSNLVPKMLPQIRWYPRNASFKNQQRGDRSPRCWCGWSRLVPAQVRTGPGSAVDFKQTGATLAAADAHGHHAPLGLAPAAFLQDVAGQPCAGHPERMADGDRAAVDVVLLRIDAE